jgi:hypothetical protein
MPVDSDTIGFLEDVKKGKPRHFVMICKGVQILSLIVYKKGTVERYKKQALEQGHGQFYHGVVDGKGLDVCFKLLSTDGYDKPPGKELILKDFLRVQAGINFKPTYAIVSELPKIDDNDEIEGAPSASSAAAVVYEATTSDTGTPKAPPADAAKFTERLKAVLPQLKQALAIDSPQAEQLKTLATKIQTLGKEQNYSEGLRLLDEAEKLAKEALASATSGPPKTAATTPSDTKAQPFSLVNAQASRLAWDSTRKKVQAELQNLEKQILATVEQHNNDESAEDEYEMADVAAGAKHLYECLDVLDNRLIDKLDDALNAEGPKREELHGQAKELIKEYQQFVTSDAFMADIDGNPFNPTSIRQMLDRTLTVLASKI